MEQICKSLILVFVLSCAITCTSSESGEVLIFSLIFTVNDENFEMVLVKGEISKGCRVSYIDYAAGSYHDEYRNFRISLGIDSNPIPTNQQSIIT